MLLHRAHLYRLDPTEEQVTTLAQWAGACRFVFNLALEQRRDWWRPGRKFNYYTQSAELTALRAEVDWIQAVPVTALRSALRAVDGAFQRFFSGLGRYPQPRKKGENDSFTILDADKIGFTRLSKNVGAVKIPKLGWIKLRWHRPLGGEPRSVTISRKGEHWYASVAWQTEVADPVPSNLPSVGIDRGVKVFAALSDGTHVEPLNAGKKIAEKLAKSQRRLARKVKFSANWKKQKAKITRLHTQAANARKDFLHKHSLEIAKSHGVVKLEKLQVGNMTRSAKGTVENPGKNVRQKSGLNRSILDQGWGMFAAMLGYKLAERGGELIYVNPAYTSQTCAECGCVDAASRRDQATFVCVHCGHEDNADVNGARNIHQARALAVEPPKRTLRRVGKRKHREEVTHVA